MDDNEKKNLKAAAKRAWNNFLIHKNKSNYE